MAEDLSADAVLQFLRECGGRAPNQELVEHFKSWLSMPGESRATARQRFKDIVNQLGTVRQENGVKYVCLRKKYLQEPGSPVATLAPTPPEQVPVISVTEASPLPLAEEERPVFQLLDEQKKKCGDGSTTTGQSERGQEQCMEEEQAAPREDPKVSTGEDMDAAADPQQQQDGGSSSPLAFVESGGKSSRHRFTPQALPSLSGEEDSGGGSRRSLCEEGSGGNASPGESPCSPGPMGREGGGLATPRSSRKTFRERMISSSPQLRRTFFAGCRGSGGESDTASIASSSAEESGGSGSVTLDPLEHAWMLSTSEGKWKSLEGLLSCDPGLFTKRDFITGFNCLHWAAKQGKQELLAMLVNFANKHELPFNINARASGGYTALHLAAMHGHVEVVKLLVGAYDADVDIRDYSGRKACQYLNQDAAEDMKGLVGSLADSEQDSAGNLGSGRWRLSKVLPSTITVHKLPLLSDDHLDGTWLRSKEVSRKPSGSSKVKPRLNRIRFRTQIIHTTPSFKDAEEDDRSLKSPLKLRPKSNVFG
ncbi:ankyrin repeat domain-containing protein SOWAHC [Microcaecilia unicolor]|uniref:Ankyrin repeat domain-containing protein SOWAHC n=1 Tax=Microcaecilia unicolor TaxID=1415580 RepID=A0A6P7XWK6_9AMPH|nr:ankyrin repeat domain-containing protein SOWAHC [Microcaecilia unicolor]